MMFRWSCISLARLVYGWGLLHARWVLQRRNSHIWDDKHLHAVFITVHQQRFSVNIWAGIVGDHLLGPVILSPFWMEHLQNMLPLLMENLSLAMRKDIWFQHDGASPHFSLVVRAHLNNTYGEQWRAEPVAWPARSPDLTPQDFFFGGMWRVSCTPSHLTPERNWLWEYALLWNKFNTELKCSTESDNHCYDGVMNVITFRVDAWNTFCKLSAKGTWRNKWITYFIIVNVT
jgi:hypothetical protein